MSRRQRRTPRWLRVKRAKEAERRAARFELDRSRRTARLVWIAVVAFCVTLLGLTCRPRQAHAAARVPITWTAPAGVRTYEAIARRPDGVVVALTLSADSAGTAPVVVKPEGSPQLGWVLISTDWRAGGWMVWIRGCNTAGCAPWSNATVHLAGMPDTLWHLERLGSAGIRAPRDGRYFKRAVGRVGWSLEREDSLTAATIEHVEVTQRRERARLCELFGYWCLRGARQSCP